MHRVYDSAASRHDSPWIAVSRVAFHRQDSVGTREW